MVAGKPRDGSLPSPKRRNPWVSVYVGSKSGTLMELGAAGAPAILGAPARCPFKPPFLVGRFGSPTKMDYRRKLVPLF